MRDNVIQRAWDVIAEVRDRAPRLPNDASTDDIVAALFDAGLLAESAAEPLRCSTCGQPHPCDHVRAVAEETQP